MRATIKENPNMVPVSPRCRSSLFLIRLVGIQPSIVCRVGNSIVGFAIAKYTATIKRATYYLSCLNQSWVGIKLLNIPTFERKPKHMWFAMGKEEEWGKERSLVTIPAIDKLRIP
jgi:hypothetical protein